MNWAIVISVYETDRRAMRPGYGMAMLMALLYVDALQERRTQYRDHLWFFLPHCDVSA